MIREGSDEILYFSCKVYLDELMSSLEDDGKEKRLLFVLKVKYKIIVKYMEIIEVFIEVVRGRIVFIWNIFVNVFIFWFNMYIGCGFLFFYWSIVYGVCKL